MKQSLQEHQVNNTFICDADTATSLSDATSHALTDYSELCLIEVELSPPEGFGCVDKDVFINFSVNFQKTANKLRKRVKHKCNARFFWNIHANKYQLTIILNRKAYPNLTNFNSDITAVASWIEASWAKVLKCNLADLHGKINYPVNAVSYK